MSGGYPDLDFDLSNHTRDQWFDEMDQVGEDHGYLEPLGPGFHALMVDHGPQLLVTFERYEDVRARKGGLPRGFEYVRKQGWSLMAIISENDDWFRSERIYRYFDRQTDDGFFEDFDDVLFYGNHACGYAAAAYSVAAPGARVLALRPLATLDPSQARWDKRYLDQRGKDFTTRYGYAPDMIEAAEQAYIIADTTTAADAMHAALFRRPNVSVLGTAHAGPRIEPMWDQMGLTAPMMIVAMNGELTPSTFGALWRARRDSLPYLRTLLKRLDKAKRPDLALRLCRFAKARGAGQIFEDRYAELTAG